VEVLRSALRHGIAGEEILHAINHAITVDEMGDDPCAGWCSARIGLETCWNWW
jgi:hypothetical protein